MTKLAALKYETNKALAVLTAIFTSRNNNNNNHYHRHRQELMRYLRERLSAVAEKHGERLLHVPGNPISCGS